MGSDGPSRRVQKCSVQASRTANITLPSGTMQRQTCTRSGVATAMASSALKVLLRVGLDVRCGKLLWMSIARTNAHAVHMAGSSTMASKQWHTWRRARA